MGGGQSATIPGDISYQFRGMFARGVKLLPSTKDTHTHTPHTPSGWPIVDESSTRCGTWGFSTSKTLFAYAMGSNFAQVVVGFGVGNELRRTGPIAALPSLSTDQQYTRTALFQGHDGWWWRFCYRRKMTLRAVREWLGEVLMLMMFSLPRLVRALPRYKRKN